MTKPLISAENLFYSIPYGESIIEDISFNLNPGDFLALIGNNGAGKSTLMDLLMGFRETTSGTLEVFQEKPLDMVLAKTRICFLSQSANLYDRLSPAQFLKFHASFYPKYSLETEKQLLDLFGIKNLNIHIAQMSTGQKRRLQIVAGFSSMPELILIDEITAVLDPDTRLLFYQLLVKYKTQYGAGILIATNIVNELKEYTDNNLHIENKKMTRAKP